MRISLLFIFFLIVSCGPSNYSQVSDLGYRYKALAQPPQFVGQQDKGAYGVSNSSQAEANNIALQKCYYMFGGNCAVTFVGDQFVGGQNNTTSSYNSAGSIPNSRSVTNTRTGYVYSNSKPVLFYDNLSGAMRECIGTVIAGTCSNYAPYNQSSYDSQTLFYNSKNGRMQKCLLEVMGKCQNFAPQPVISSSDQLFYNPRTKSMSTCLNSNNQGKCLSFGIAPSQKQDTGSYRVDQKSNPYYKTAPRTPEGMINLGMDMLKGNCTLGLNC